MDLGLNMIRYADTASIVTRASICVDRNGLAGLAVRLDRHCGEKVAVAAAQNWLAVTDDQYGL
jgi:hypothetical protein